jgi:hypothetical protein
MEKAAAAKRLNLAKGLKPLEMGLINGLRKQCFLPDLNRLRHCSL